MARKSEEILELLRKMDAGYAPTEPERKALTEVRMLDLLGNGLTSLPESIGSLTDLTALDLSHNRLTSLPESIGSLTGLTELDLWWNGLTSLPESIGSLTGLTVLGLQENNLTSLPESIGSLTGLTTLRLWDNDLTSLPESIGSLTGLTELKLSRNRLTSLPESIGSLTGLTELDLWGNDLTSLPESLGGLTGLKWLDLSCNPLTRVPEWLLALNLPFVQKPRSAPRDEITEYINLYEVPLSLQPISLFDQSGDTSPNRAASRKLIEDYFRARHIPLREAKVILLGDAAAGKTYTVQRMKNGCQKGDYPTETTHGILIEDLSRRKDGVDYTVRVWDFGGQDIMNEMHRCFLTERTCYAVLVDTRNNGQTRRARRWLRTVQSVAPDAPVVLLVNEMTGGTNLDLDAVSLRREFPNLRAVHHCSARDAEPEEFRREVETPLLETALSMDSCKMTLPESWERVRQELLTLRENNYYIDRAAFHCLCDAHGVPGDDQLRVWLLNWFNDMGVCFSYHLENGRERGEDYKILEPKWLTGAIYRLLWEKEQNDDGIITHDEIRLILKQKGSEERIKKGIPCLPGVKYEPEECEYVLEIMRKFGISYRVNEREEFMPNLCKPDSKRDPAPKRYAQLVSVRFRYALLPEKIIHGLMIYCYRYLSRGRMWRKGFWLENSELGLCAVVYTQEEKNEADALQIDVYAVSESAVAADWLQPLCKAVREQNNRAGLNAEEWVLARAEDEEKWFRLDTVWNWRKKNKDALMGEEVEFPIRPLLSLVYGSWLSAAEGVYAVPDEKKPNGMAERMARLEEQIPKLITALENNTNATDHNTKATAHNTEALRQITDLLQRIRDGKYDPPKSLLDEIMRIVQSQEELLSQFQKSKKASKLERLRDLLGVGANVVTIGQALAPAVPKLTPYLSQLFQQTP